MHTLLFYAVLYLIFFISFLLYLFFSEIRSLYHVYAGAVSKIIYYYYYYRRLQEGHFSSILISYSRLEVGEFLDIAFPNSWTGRTRAIKLLIIRRMYVNITEFRIDFYFEDDRFYRTCSQIFYYLLIVCTIYLDEYLLKKNVFLVCSYYHSIGNKKL